MITDDLLDGSISSWLQESAPAQLPQRVLTATFERTRHAPQQRTLDQVLRRPAMGRFTAAFAWIAVAVAALLAATVIVFSGLARPTVVPTTAPSSSNPRPTAAGDLGIFEPIAGRMVFRTASAVSGTTQDGAVVPLTTPEANPLAWSDDGTRLLLERDNRLYVLDRDGSETPVGRGGTTARSADISPDGLRVIWAGGVGESNAIPGTCCERYGIVGTTVDGGMPTMLVTLDSAAEAVSYSPDGNAIAYVFGGGDHGHRVWIANADGTDAREIVANDTTLGPSHVRGLSWSPVGDRIALLLEGTIYTFGSGGSNFVAVQSVGNVPGAYWSPDGSQIGTKGPWHPGRSAGDAATPSPASDATATPLGASARDLLDGFVAARIAGAGAERFVDAPEDIILGDAKDIPLLYATTSGDAYQRGDYEQVGAAWPYGWSAVKVRLFADTTVVEQMFFVRPGTPNGLDYVLDAFGTDIPATTENGRPVALPYRSKDGILGLQVAHPWVFQYPGAPIRLVPPGALPTTDGGERNGWIVLRVIVDPVPIGTPCQPNPDQCDARTLADGIRANGLLETTVPQAVTVGDISGVRMEVTNRSVLGIAVGPYQRLLLYVFDAPAGSPARVVAIGVVAPTADFARAVASVPTLSSIGGNLP